MPDSIIPPAKEPKFATPELREQWLELRKLMEDNAQAESALAPYGAGIMPATAVCQRIQNLAAYMAEQAGRPEPQVAASPDLAIQLNLLLNAVIGQIYPWAEGAENQAHHIAIDRRYQEGLAEFLVKAKSEVVKAQLSAGANLSPEMIRELNKQSQALLHPQPPNGAGPGLIPGRG
jgi:hypothetical protein